MKSKFFILAGISFILLSSCNIDPSKSGNSGGVMLPNVSGSAGEVLIVMDQDNWKGMAGNNLKELLEQEFPALPQPEPLFDIIQISPAAFDDLFKRHRTIIITDISSEHVSPEIRFLENVWAKPQLLIRLNAANREALAALISNSHDKLLYNIQTYDRKRLMDIFVSSKDAGIKSTLNKFRVNLAIPRGYKTDIDAPDFAMFSIESSRTSQVISVYRYPFTGSADISTSTLVAKRNEMMQKFTRGSQTGSYMITSPMFPVIIYDLQKNGRNLIEMRGLWELNKGFMGGPFISHTYVDNVRNEIITVEGYVYNPNEKKRNLMRHVEAIIYSMEIID
jgi:hypothetical protein